MAKEAQDTSLATPKVLVVDDRPENIFAMRRLLEPVDAELLTAETGNEALALVLHHEFAVALLDVQMPEMDGFELAELMRGHESTSGVPIIFVTAISTEDEFVFKGYGSGAVDYLFKPISPEVLKSKVTVFLDLYRQRKELEVEIALRKRAQEENENLIAELRHALEQVRTLQGIIPICMYCKKIRNDKGYWEQVDVYIRQHSDTQFSHGLCDECERSRFPEIADDEIED